MSNKLEETIKPRKCDHKNVPGYCPDCGNPNYTLGSELYFQRFQDVYNLGALKMMQDFDKVKTIEDFNKTKERMYPLMRSLIEAYGASVEKTVEDLKLGKGKYK